VETETSKPNSRVAIDSTTGLQQVSSAVQLTVTSLTCWHGLCPLLVTLLVLIIVLSYCITVFHAT